MGKRLRPLTLDRPKAMVEIAGRPIVEWQVRWLAAAGVKEIVLCVGVLWEKIKERYGDGTSLGVKLHYSVEGEPMGTGGAFHKALDYIKGEPFFGMNGDVMTNLNPMRLREETGKVGALALIPFRSPYGIVVTDGPVIESFKEKAVLSDVWMSAGVYYFSEKARKYLPERGDVEQTTFPQLAGERGLAGVKFPKAFWRTADTVKDVEEANKEGATIAKALGSLADA